MSEEIIKEVNSQVDVPPEHLEKADKKDREDKRMEKLSLLKVKYEKAASVQAAAEKKTKDIYAQISKIEKELHAEKIAGLEKACGKEINITEVTLLVSEIRKAGLSVYEVIELISGNPQNNELTERELNTDD